MSKIMDHAKQSDGQQGPGTDKGELLLSSVISRRKLLAAMGGLGAVVAAGGLLLNGSQTAKAAISGDVVLTG